MSVSAGEEAGFVLVQPAAPETDFLRGQQMHRQMWMEDEDGESLSVPLAETFRGHATPPQCLG